MASLILKLDDAAEQEIARLQKYFDVTSKAQVIRKGLALLKVAAQIKETNGQLIARKGDKERIIFISKGDDHG